MYKLLQNINGYYIYDAHINGIKKISEELYHFLQKRSDEENQTASSEYYALKEQGFFDTADFDMIHPYSEHYEYLLERGLNRMTLQVTRNCNLRCSYCPYTENDGRNRLHSAENMSWETAKRAVDFLKAHSADALYVHIGFYGGEPLLNYAIVKKTIEYAEMAFEGKTLSFGMTTNAVLLSNEILDFFEKHNMFLTISLDGPKDIHDLHRKFPYGSASSFDHAARSLNTISNRYPQLKKKTIISMVIDQQLKISDYNRVFKELPVIEDFPIRVSLIDDNQLKEKHPATPEFRSEYQYYSFINMLCESEQIEGSKFKNVFMYKGLFDSTYTQNALLQPPIQFSGYPSGPCVPGYTQVFVCINGDMVPCEKVSEAFDCLKIGTVDRGFDLQKCRELLNVALLTEEECKQCWCFRFCGSCCNFCCDVSGLSKKLRLSSCKKAKAQAEGFLYRYLAFHP